MSEETIHDEDVFDALMKDEDISAITYGVREIEIGGVKRRQAFETSDPAEIDTGATAEMRAARERGRHFVFETSVGTIHILASIQKGKSAVGRKEAKAQMLRLFRHYAKKCAENEISLNEWKGQMERDLKSAPIFHAMRPSDDRNESEILREAEAENETLHLKLKILDGLFERLKSGKMSFDSRDFSAGLGSLAKRD